MEFMQELEWPGNVRELASVVRVTLQTATHDQIDVSDLNKIITTSSFSSSNIDEASAAVLSASRTLKEDLAEVDKKKIENTLERCSGNVSKAASMLGISRETLHNKVRKYGINTALFRVRK